MHFRLLFALILVVGSTLMLASCTPGMNVGGQPFVTKDPKYLPRAQDQKYVSICYNADNTDEGTIKQLAQKSCQLPGANVRVFSHDLVLNECPVVSKARVTFLCIAPTP